MAYNASQRKQVRKAEKDQAQLERARIDFIIAAMSTLQGRAWFHELLAACHIFADPFTGDALLEAHNKGERNVGLKIYADIVTHCPDYFISMMKEAAIKEEINGRSPDAFDDDDTAEHDDASEFDVYDPTIPTGSQHTRGPN